jgi:hypothetical protein
MDSSALFAALLLVLAACWLGIWRIERLISGVFGWRALWEATPLDDCPELEYKPLPNKGHIRLIALLPSSNPAWELHCTLQSTPLLGRPKVRYEALSYAWGDPVFSQKLFCDTRQHAHPADTQFSKTTFCGQVHSTHFKITVSLHAALLALRSTKRVRYLWADAICINQKDDLEKNGQIQQMRHIYMEAARVIVWLGGRHDYGDKILQFLEKLTTWKPDSIMVGRSIDAAIKNRLESIFKAERVDLLEKFFQRAWFSRRWIIQELTLSTHATMICEATQIDWLKFANAVNILFERRSRFGSIDPVLTSLQMIRLLQRGIYSSRTSQTDERQKMTYDGTERRARVDTLDLLIFFNVNECSDERDRIYALLGISQQMALAENSYTLGLTPNYQLSPPIVYFNFAKSCLCGLPRLDILHCAGTTRAAGDGTSIPSWIPDWRFPLLFKPFVNVPWFKAGIGEDRMSFEVNSIDHSLALNGLLLDSVKTVGDVVREPLDPQSLGSQLLKWKAIINQKLSKKFYLTHERTEEAFALTLIADLAIPGVFHRQNTLHERFPLQEECRGTDPTQYHIVDNSEVSQEQRRKEYLRGYRYRYLNDVCYTSQFQDSDFAEQYAVLARETMQGRSFFTTGKGYLGIGPGDTKAGDIIAVFFGARNPFVLRPSVNEDGSRYWLLGDSYVHGFMHGMALRMPSLRKRRRILSTKPVSDSHDTFILS